MSILRVFLFWHFYIIDFLAHECIIKYNNTCIQFLKGGFYMVYYNDSSGFSVDEERQEKSVEDILEDYMLDFLYKSGYMEH